MAISKAKRVRRAELQILRKLKCNRHSVRRCENSDCIRQVREALYGTRRKTLMHEAPPQIDWDSLFYRLHHPEESYFESLPDDPPEAPKPISSPVPVSTIPHPVTDPRQLTLRQRIELAKAAA
jgi:hypothetical protein